MKKQRTLIFLFFSSLLLISYLINSTDKKYVKIDNSVSTLREKHTSYLNNSPFKKTLKLSKEERKAKGLPPNKYYERMWELTMNPATGKPEPYKVLELQQNRNKKDKTLSNRNPGDAVSNSWEERGPNNVGGRTRVVLFDPNDATNKRVFAGGVSGGLWKNEDITDPSSSWTSVSGVPSNMNVSCITVDPNNSLIWYIGTGEQYTFGAAVGNGVYKTIDGGSNWTNIPVQLAGVGDLSSSTSLFLTGIYYINDIIAWDNGTSTEVFIGVGGHLYGDAANPNNWLGLQSAGLYKTTDNGAIWNRIESVNMEFQWSGFNFYFIPNDFEISTDISTGNTTIWFGTITTPGIGGAGGGRIFSSTNGLTWTEAGASPLPNSNRVELAVSSTTTSKMYALTEGTTSTGPHIYATTDAFTKPLNDPLPETYELAKPNDADTGIPENDFTRGQDFYDLMIEVDPTNDDIIYVGGIDLFRTTQGENTDLVTEWEQISKWSNNNNLAGLSCSIVHADQHAFTFRPGNNNEAVIGCDGGVYYSNDLSIAKTNSTFSVRNTNYNVTQFYYGAYGPNSNTELILAGAQDNGSQFINNASAGINSSVDVFGGDGAFSEIDNSGDYMIVSYVYNYHYYYDLTGLGTDYSIESGNTEGDFINQAGLDHNLDILFSNGTNGSYQINRYHLGASSATKSQFTDVLLTSAPTAFKVSPYTTASTLLMVGTADGKLLKLTNAQLVNTNSIGWEDISGGSFIGSISDIEFGETEDDIFVTFHNYGVQSIWYSPDGGTNWQNKEGNLPDMPVKCILQNPLLSNEVIVGTELGVWASSNFNDTSPTWTSSYNGMRDVKVVDLDLRISDNNILATTFGRGVFTGKFSATDFTITTSNTTVTTCNNTAVFNFDFNTSPSYNTVTTFSTSGEPGSVSINFSPSSLSTQGTFTMTVSNVSSLAVGDYPITVIGTGNQTNSIDIILRVDDTTINIVNPTSPINEATDIAYFGTNFTWSSDIEASSYDFDISTDAGFNTIIETTNTTNTSYTISTILDLSTVYYWRVRSKNECITANYSETQKFQTNTSQCVSESVAPNLSIPDGIGANQPGNAAESIINFPSSFTIADVNVSINISHTYIQDLVISLISPNNTEIVLFNRECNGEDNIAVTYNDDASAIITCASPVSGTAIPSNLLSGFNSENVFGDWTLRVFDYWNTDTGTINNWSLEICENQPITNSILTKATPVTVNANSTYTFLTADMEASSSGSTDTEQIYMLTELPVVGDLKLNNTVLNLGETFSQNDINTSKLTYVNSSGISTSDVFKVDITNATNGFLPNQIININIDAVALSIDDQFFEKTGTSVFPTVSSGEFSIVSKTLLGKTVIEIYNINGQKVFYDELNITNSAVEKISVNGLASGMYILKLSAESAQGSKKIIIK
ncbi:putative secreted protein (Por secretion system target) [Lutibacter oceani]|uniref:Putative secreted protein (Por secretion system target) n=1 Tax=Lutibacter oceani TaxID=1853311 RepID=A0A3D9RUR2_9FLAO|nr:proprotein convertase P-domain-containing protein [Lutibacter oceani]REE83713.1 putative secreted protein (Por secretion system target) [Lutibacter oceani]